MLELEAIWIIFLFFCFFPILRCKKQTSNLFLTARFSKLFFICPNLKRTYSVPTASYSFLWQGTPRKTLWRNNMPFEAKRLILPKLSYSLPPCFIFASPQNTAVTKFSEKIAESAPIFDRAHPPFFYFDITLISQLIQQFCYK